MPSLTAPFSATVSLLNRAFRPRSATTPGKPQDIRHRARIDLAQLPDHLKRDIGILDD